MKELIKFHTAANCTVASPDTPRIVAIGVFDGVHAGHRTIIESAARRAAELNAVALALSFTPHPRQLLNPDQVPELLLPESVRVSKLFAAGAQECAFIGFTPEVAALPPEDFLDALAANSRFNVAGICVGSRWRFGRNGSGNAGTLGKFCAEHNWDFAGVPELEIAGETVSSTAIRAAAKAGDLAKVRLFSGRDLTLYGKVVHGCGIAGSELDAPTANLHCSAGITPPDGVYAGVATVDGRSFPAAVNIGFSPTFNGSCRRIEVHLISDEKLSLYDKNMLVALTGFIRNERKFSSPEELKTQIASDIKIITALAGNKK